MNPLIQVREGQLLVLGDNCGLLRVPPCRLFQYFRREESY
jgi:hypothetical protein